MSPSATPATRNEAPRRWKPPKVTPDAELTIGTAIRPRADGCERLRTVADGCGRLRTVEVVNATSREHTFNPQTPRMKREPLLRIREQGYSNPKVYAEKLIIIKNLEIYTR